MKRPRTVRLGLEALEERSVPTVNVFYNGSTLTLTGAPNSTTLPFLIQHVAGTPSSFHVTDGKVSLGTYSVPGNINIQFTRELAAVQVDLNQGTLGGNLTINLGAGLANPANPPTQSDVSVADQSGTGTGSVAGTVTIAGGNGQETYDIGQYQAASGALTQGTVTIRGSLYVTAKASAVNPSMLQVGFGSAILGNVTTSQVAGVVIGNQNTGSVAIGGNINISTSGTSTGANVTLTAKVGGSVTVNDLAAVAGFNSFSMLPANANPAVNSTIGGNLYVAFGPATFGNLYVIHGGVGPSSSIIFGNVTLIDNNSSPSAAPPDTIDLGDGGVLGATATIGGSLTIQMANGFNQIAFGEGTVVGENLYVRGGNGTNDLGGGTLGGDFLGTVNGNVSIVFGNGTNTFNPSFSGTALAGIGGRLTYTGGNGSNSVTYNLPVGSAPDVFMTFGSGTNSLVLQPGNGISANISSLTVFGVPGANNTYDDSAVVPVTFPVTLINFP